MNLKFHLFIFTLFFLRSLTGNSQSMFEMDTLNYTKNKPLTWNDFKGDILEYSHLSGSIFSGISFGYNASIKNGSGYRITAYMDRKQSWHKVVNRSTEDLKYYQTIFDLNYFLAQSAFIKATADSNFWGNSFVKQYRNADYESGLLIKRFEDVSNKGKDNRIVQMWSDSITQKISRLDSLHFIDMYHPTSMVFTFGINQPLLYSGINDYLSLSTMGGMSIEFIIRNYVAAIQLSFGGTKVKEEFIADGNRWATSQKPGYSLAGLDVGYAINRNLSMIFTPVFSLSYLTITSPENKEAGKSEVNSEGYFLGSGICIDYLYNALKVLKKEHFIPNRGFGFVRFRIIAGYARMNEDMKGVMVNAGLSWGLSLKKIYRRYY